MPICVSCRFQRIFRAQTRTRATCSFSPDWEALSLSLHPPAPVVSKLWHFMLWRSARAAASTVKSEGFQCKTCRHAYILRPDAAVVLEAFDSRSELPDRCQRSLCLGLLLVSRLIGMGRLIRDDPYFQLAIAGL